MIYRLHKWSGSKVYKSCIGYFLGLDAVLSGPGLYLLESDLKENGEGWQLNKRGYVLVVSLMREMASSLKSSTGSSEHAPSERFTYTSVLRLM